MKKESITGILMVVGHSENDEQCTTVFRYNPKTDIADDFTDKLMDLISVGLISEETK